MERLELIIPCHFGLESVVKREVYDLGYDISKVSDGRVAFWGDAEAIARANIHIRSGERVLVKLGEFRAESFEELFEGTKAVPVERFVPPAGRFWVAKASSVRSKLFSPSDIQSVMKKAMVERMRQAYGNRVFAEEGEAYPFRVFLLEDRVTVALDTTGESLHKRGYRKLAAPAPIAENLAAGILSLTPFGPGRILVDPFCGSGTIAIEAALMVAGVAPGAYREFLAQAWTHVLSPGEWESLRQEAIEAENRQAEADIQAYDIDPRILDVARANAKAAGVDHMIHFQARPVSALSHPKKYGFLITNPPYGQRLEDDGELFRAYQDLGQAYAALDSWSLHVISAYEKARQALARAVGRPADKNRKIYNGMLKTYLYQYLGPKPPKRRRQG